MKYHGFIEKAPVLSLPLSLLLSRWINRNARPIEFSGSDTWVRMKEERRERERERERRALDSYESVARTARTHTDAAVVEAELHSYVERNGNLVGHPKGGGRERGNEG